MIAQVTPRWWPFVVHALSFFLMPLAWVWILSNEHALFFIFVAPAIVLTTWMFAIAGIASGWRYDRRHESGPGRVAGWASLALLAMILLAGTYLLFGAVPFNGGWVLLALAGVGHAFCAHQLLWRPAPGRPAPASGPDAPRHLALAALLVGEGAVLLVALSMVRLLGTYGEIAVALNATLGVVSLALGVSLLALRSNEEPVPAGLHILIAAYAVAFLLVLLAGFYMNVALAIQPGIGRFAMLVLLGTNVAKLSLTWKAFGRNPVPA